MLIWELAPTDPSDSRWVASKHKGLAIIRAATAERARQIAKSAFDMGSDRVSGVVPGSAWGCGDMVRCRRLEHSDYDENGPEAILNPAEYEGEW
jgi:hypothetical protein